MCVCVCKIYIAIMYYVRNITNWQSHRPHKTIYIYSTICVVAHRIIGIDKGPPSIGFRKPHRRICFLFTPPLRNCCGIIRSRVSVCISCQAKILAVNFCAELSVRTVSFLQFIYTECPITVSFLGRNR